MLASGSATCKRSAMVPSSRANLRRRAVAIDMALTSLALAAGLAALVALLEIAVSLSERFYWTLAAAGLSAVALVFVLATRHLAADRFGPANRVTLARVALVVLLLALIGEPPLPWLVVVIVSVTLALDGVDGWLARKYDVASKFGARFDMETDALLMLVLSIVVWQYEKAGAWILLGGLMRYLFVAASALLPFLNRPLPQRRRRQAAFVTHAIILIVCVIPFLPKPFSGALGLIGLAILTWSFAVDVCYLARMELTGSEQEPH